MRRTPSRPGTLAGAVLTAAALVASGVALPAAGAPRDAAAGSNATGITWQQFAGRLTTPGDPVAGLRDVDRRGTAAPSAAQRQAAEALGAQVTWNDFGTPASVFALDGSLAPATSSDPVKAARAYLAQHATAFGLSTAEVGALDLVSSQRFEGSDARAVLFRQDFGALSPALGSMVTVGVAHGDVVYASSSLVKGAGSSPDVATPVLSPVQGWLKAAVDTGWDVDLPDLTTTASGGWTRITAKGNGIEQQARMRSLAMADGSVRPVIEANVVRKADVSGGISAYTEMVDAVSGDVLYRENKVDNQDDAFGFQGEFSATDCGPKHSFKLTDGNTQQILVAAAAVNSANDIVVKLFGPGGDLLGSGDLGTSPETLTYTDTPIPAGTYQAQVCPFATPTAPFLPPYNYALAVGTSNQQQAEPQGPYPPKWRYFTANPSPRSLAKGTTPKNRVLGCWQNRYQGQKVAGCDLPTGSLQSLATHGPWDYDFTTNSPTLTTAGNNVSDREAWLSPLTPGGTQAPVAPDRIYSDPFTDVWNESRCDPSNLVPGGNDIFASVTNLFVAHNRMHDFSYFLGFTEANYNLQVDNFGRQGAGGDPEVGNVQAGAQTGGTPSYLGRDNANQIALQDGVPGITNQYLFQPIAGAFYSPCADGSLDMSVVGHEYTHAISNRMIGGPDEGITSEQGGAMGESWGDLTAAEYMFTHGYRTGANPWAVGVYATGNDKVGIRDFAINHNPLNYSDYGFDSTGNEVHADGEIWNATNWRVRQALVKKFNARGYDYRDKGLQLACAQGKRLKAPLPAHRCPGNRRWIQLMFDAFLLQPGATDMLQARNAMLAADQMRYDGANQKVLWLAFARSAMGKDASTPNADSGNVVPGFVSPGTPSGTVTFAPRTPSGKRVEGTVFIGRFEARVSPVADTRPKSDIDPSVRMAPGRYTGIVRAAGYGMKRFAFRVGSGDARTVRVTMPQNLASTASGAKVIGSSGGSLNTDFLIDDTENTNWAGVNDSKNVDAKGAHPFVAVDLAGDGLRTIHRVNVSAYLRPAGGDDLGLPLLRDAQPDPDSGSRFTALRRFRIDVCRTACGSKDARWVTVFTSKGNAFPSARPRPVAPTLTLRGFDVRDTQARAVRFVALENQCTGTPGYAGEQDADPSNATDCKTASDRGMSVRAAELQVF